MFCSPSLLLVSFLLFVPIHLTLSTASLWLFCLETSRNIANSGALLEIYGFGYFERAWHLLLFITSIITFLRAIFRWICCVDCVGCLAFSFDSNFGNGEGMSKLVSHLCCFILLNVSILLIS
uniref:Candidate secreted effector n=1 Tax=Meloidogyne incognita TaxID=6306 RepID=A0A914MVJ7_MELIC